MHFRVAGKNESWIISILSITNVFLRESLIISQASALVKFSALVHLAESLNVSFLLVVHEKAGRPKNSPSFIADHSKLDHEISWKSACSLNQHVHQLILHRRPTWSVLASEDPSQRPGFPHWRFHRNDIVSVKSVLDHISH